MEITIYTDGACTGNPGCGGYCAIIQFVSNGGNYERIVSGSESNTTNNRMELRAVIEGLKSITTGEKNITVVSDSKYVCDAINQRWLQNWKKNNWRKSDNKQVLNDDLWKELDGLLSKLSVNFEWIKGHNGNPINERCDRIAVEEYRKHLNKSSETTTSKDTHYVIFAEWCVDYEGGSCIVGVYHSEEKAKEAFRHRVDTDDKILANDYGYEIYEDSDTCFDSGENGEYVKDHITVQLIQVESDDSEAS